MEHRDQENMHKMSADSVFSPVDLSSDEIEAGAKTDVEKLASIHEEIEASAESLCREFESYSGHSSEKLRRAFEFARSAHRNQKRATGEPYITHPLAVTHILIELKPDIDSLCAALLHDTVEDSGVTLPELVELYGNDVAELVDGVTKLEKMSYSSREELQAENYRKMFLAMAKDIRVVLIKLADRVHNMRTMKHLPSYKQEYISQETLDIYAPLADRLGVYRWKWELEDLCLRYLDPNAYYELVGAIAQKRSEREAYLTQVISEIRDALDSIGIRADVTGRPKHFYSVYRKMKQKEKVLDQIYDLFACRVLVDTVGDCYYALGQVHEMYRPMPGRFKDYIAVPKANHYQSLHTTVFGPKGYPFEVQIRTHEMHQTAEFGIAAHWKYKQGITDPQQSKKMDFNTNWLDQMLQWQKDFQSSSEFIKGIKGGLEPDEVYVFTPRGDVFSLPVGSVPIDLAYAIHSGLGNRMYGAKVNGNQVAQDYQLQIGDIVEILASDKVNGPSYDWLKLVKSQGARSKILHWFKKERRQENIRRGQDLLEKEIQRSGFSPLDLIRPEYIRPILKRYTLKSEEDLFAAIGNGTSGLTPGRVIPRLRDGYLKTLSQEERESRGYFQNQAGQFVYRPELLETMEALEQSKKSHGSEVKIREQHNLKSSDPSGVEIKGIDNCLIRLSRCCSPMPGDPIIGYITIGRGVAVHRKDCPNIRHMLEHAASNPEEAKRAARLIDAAWSRQDKPGNSVYPVTLNITAHDRRNLFSDVSNAVSEEKVTILSGKFNSYKDISALLTLQVEVNSQEQYKRLVGRIRAIPDVIDVKRA